MRAYRMLVCRVMARTAQEKASPFASWALINDVKFSDIIWA